MVIVVSYLVYYNTFLQNVTDTVIKCNNGCKIKCDKRLLQNESAFSLQNGTVLLQNKTFITKCIGTHCQRFYS